MSEQTKKIVLPAYLLRRLEAFRIVKGEETSYIVRDKLQGKTHDFDAWQFFILEVLPGCDTLEKLQSVFHDRFDRQLLKTDVDALFAMIADRKLFDENASQHPLLAPFTRKTYEVVEGGKAQVKSFSAAVAGGTPVSAPAPAAAPAAPAQPAGPANEQRRDKNGDLPAGIQDALGLDWATTDRMISLFDPRPLLKLLSPVVMNLRYTIYIVPLLVAAALLLIFGQSDVFIADLKSLHPQIDLVEHLVFVLLTVHVITTLTAAFVAHSYKVSVDTFGLTLTFGFMPRWVLKMTGAENLSRKQTMWLHGSTLIARMIIFSLGTIIWYATRDSHTALPETGLLFTFSCGVGLLIESGNPLVKANCYYLVSAFLNEPHLRGKAYAALMNKFKGGVYKKADSNMLALYALLSATYIVFITLLCAYVLAKYVLGDIDLSGSGILIVLGFASFMLYRNYAGMKKFSETFERQVQFDRWRTRTLQAEGVEEGEVKTTKPSYWKIAALVCVVLVLFLPYPYEPSGNFTIFPVQKAELTTDTPGVIAEVKFDGGEAVKKGTIIARIAHDDYLAELKVLEAQVDEQFHIVQNLKTLPKPEEVKLAEQELEVAKSHEPFTAARVPRLQALYKEGAVTFEELENARKEHEVDVMQIAEKEANLQKAKTGPTKEEIAAAEARLEALKQQRDGEAAKIDRTYLRMPFDGNILTLHLQDRLNSYLEKGKPFAEVENTGFVTAQVQVVESDLQYIQIGSKVRARPMSYFNDEFEGKVTLIDRNVTQKSFGNVVNVIATFENKDGRLKTGMAGEAKVAPVSMPVWKAFTTSIQRFIRVQAWAWIP